MVRKYCVPDERLACVLACAFEQGSAAARGADSLPAYQSTVRANPSRNSAAGR